MGNSGRLFVISVILLLITGSCKHHDDIFAGKPLSTYLGGKWILEKIVTPTRTLTGEQIGFAEIREVQHELDGTVDRIFRNDTLYAQYFWATNPGTITNDKKKTVLMSYRGGLKRFFKLSKQDGKPMAMEASDYLPEIGTARDSVKFFYSQVLR